MQRAVSWKSKRAKEKEKRWGKRKEGGEAHIQPWTRGAAAGTRMTRAGR